MNPANDASPSFAMITCAHGAELAVKQSIAAEGWRLAFSRPGFVTAKHDSSRVLPTGIFARTSSWSIGQARSQDGSEQIQKLIESLEGSDHAGRPFDQLHVWSKDRAAIGRFGFEPGIDEVAGLVSEQVFAALSDKWVRCDAANRIAEPGESVLDVVLVEPSHWFFGTHTATTWPTRWPGAVQPINPADPPVSRAYYKAAEAITWSGFDMQPGDLAVEIGSAPGGACGRLLELGMRVIGVDPAEMDPRIDEHPNFRHIQARGGDLPRREFRGAKWMLVDSNVKPDQTLVTVGNIVTNRQSDFRGLLITLKLGDYDASESISRWKAKVESWKPESVVIRQLARNKCEVCFAVAMPG
ncbi:putative 23S rRNA ribose 2'-O-ribose methyltransferase [Rubripirellula lacrimiformis]|uniref:Putative 23S rRNA ribose 2'-O-ribose methyltransferase n=1 Tax=Rubripirellula lacrimiformis TaxID=1930273 RepID=A0A517N6T8_9BACT|nr:SAM-dependent methyltransferase [Rubripirellula lacrimiformis]QDT02866.1 putative 23S rRNA ribose 2'-O-ribose methyltransferase [Rubripirellula lacrimiformis]